MKLLRILSIISFFAISLTLASCGKSLKSDPKAEQKFIGSWESTSLEKLNDVTDKYTTIYNFSPGEKNNTFTATINIDRFAPTSIHLATISFSGEWSATNSKIFLTINPGSPVLSFAYTTDTETQKIIENDIISKWKNNDFKISGEIIESSPTRIIWKEKDGKAILLTKPDNTQSDAISAPAAAAANTPQQSAPKANAAPANQSPLSSGHHSISGYAEGPDGRSYPFSIEFNVNGSSISNAKYHNPNYGVHCNLSSASYSNGYFNFNGKIGKSSLSISFSANSPYSGRMIQDSKSLPIYMKL